MAIHDFCQCCGFNSVADSYEICPVCYWENDPVQNKDPLCRIGANKTSLYEAQQSLLIIIPQSIQTIDQYTRNKNWKILVINFLKQSDIENGMDYFYASSAE